MKRERCYAVVRNGVEMRVRAEEEPSEETFAVLERIVEAAYVKLGLKPEEGAMGEEKSKRGFGSMDPAKQREIASKGGKAAHVNGTAHKFSAEEAAEAGRKGGAAVSRDRQHMAEIGRVGGMNRGKCKESAE